MLTKENNYDFRKRMLEIHERDIRDFSLAPETNEYVLTDGLFVLVPQTADDVVLTAGRDFVDYLFTSMGVSAMLKKSDTPLAENCIFIGYEADTKKALGESAGYKGFRIDIENTITITGYDSRGIAQALYRLEELMTLRKAPYLNKQTIAEKAMFSPMMVHSGYGLDEYPDEHLAAIAHEGRDAILVFAKDVDTTPYGYLDFNELIHRAAKYGLDVYAYSYLQSDRHPEDKDAEAYYEANYGRLFEKCPGLKGVTLVGESVGFPSKDPNVSPDHKCNTDATGLPLGKPRAGWWPCEDFPEWLNLIKKVVRNHKPDADIVFWTYNWGRQPADVRLKLIESLPTDITLQATFEMFERYEIEGYGECIADYSLKFEGPGYYFKTEAEAAAKRGIKLYAMTNTGGLTWDMGLIPYQPMPYQWMRRYEAMKKAHEEWGLCGLMESHHYGFYPSFISKLSKRVFNDPKRSQEEILTEVLISEYGAENAPQVDEALKHFSEAIRHYTPTDPDQYGAFRIGPAYPFSFRTPMKSPCAPYAMFGNRIYFPFYDMTYAQEVVFYKGAPLSIKLQAEINSLEKMKAEIAAGLEILRALPDKNDKLLYLLNLGEYMYCCVQTGINAKKWYKLTCRFNNAESKEEILTVMDEMEALIYEEIKNAENAIPFVELDSRLGWEPSMEYMGDAEHIQWKIKELHYILDTEIKHQRIACE